MPNTSTRGLSASIVQAPPVTLLLATDRPVSRTRDLVTFVLALDNASGSDVGLTFNSSQVYDVVVTFNDIEVWRWAADRGFGQVITDRVFPPGLTLLGRETWDWRDLTGAPVPPGLYRALGSLKTVQRQTGNSVELMLDVP